MKIIVVKNGDSIDISDFVSNMVWSGQKNRAARSLTFEYIDMENMPIELGDRIIFLTNQNRELFRGVVFTSSVDQDNIYDVKCYDTLIYLAKNRDTFTFRDVKASDIVRSLATQFAVSVGQIVDTGYIIPALDAPQKTLYNIIIEALSITYQHTGIRYALRDVQGNLNLFRRIERVQPITIEYGRNLGNWGVSNSAEELFTRVKVDASDSLISNSVTAENVALFSRFGILQFYEKVGIKENAAQLQDRANTLLAEKSQVLRNFRVESIGHNDAIAGEAAFIRIENLNIGKAFYIDEDTHTYNDGGQGDENHTMSLTLNEVTEIN